MLSWIDARAAKDFGTTMARFHIAHMQQAVGLNNQQFAAKSEALSSLMGKQIASFVSQNKLNIYKLAQMGNTFKWVLKDAGCDDAKTHALTQWLIATANDKAGKAVEPDCHFHLGNAYLLDPVHPCFDNAAKSYLQALAAKPDFAEAHFNLGRALLSLGDITGAKDCFEKTMAIQPDHQNALSGLLFCQNYTQHQPPFLCLDHARRYGSLITKMAKERFATWPCNKAPKRLKVGMVSGDLRNHPVGYFLESMLAQIDPNKIELIAFPTQAETDDLTVRIKPHFSAWKSLSGLNDKAAARLIHGERVHVLMDLSGHTAHNRLPVFAWKPAPVQVSWLGYMGTTGMAQMDYLLADDIRVPKAHREHFTETIWTLPDTRMCFTAPDINLPVQPLPALANGYLTFACFQNLSKLGDAVLNTWGIILNAMPTAKLRLQCNQLAYESARRKTAERLKQHGIDPARVTLLGSVARKDYLAAYAGVDINLDSFPYPGTTTTCEAIWMGVPTLTMTGDRMVARNGASILTAAGLADWVATSKADYVVKALALANDVPRLAATRAGLRTRALASPLFDAVKFARNFEAALWGMWQQSSREKNW